MHLFYTRLTLLLLCLTTAGLSLSAQGLVVEWQSPPGAQPPGFLLDINGFQNGQLDYDGNGLNEIVTLQTPPGGQPTLVIISDNGTILLGGVTEIAGHPVTAYKFRGFDNVAGDAEKELIFAPKPGSGASIVVGRLQGDMGLGITTIGSNIVHNDSLIFLITVQNMDADVTCELVTYEFPAGVLQVWGEGFTPELGGPQPEEGTAKSMACDDFAVQWISPPNLSWPSFDRGYLPPGYRDFNGDGTDDLAWIGDDGFLIVNPVSQDTLAWGVFPGDIWTGDEFGPYLLGFFDFCGSGQKQILLTAANELLSFPILLQETDRWLVVTQDTLYFRLHDLFNDLPNGNEPVTLRSIWDPNQDGRMELVFQHEINRRIILVGSDGDGFQEGPPAGLAPPDPTPNSGPYDLALKFESEPGSRPFFNLGELLDRRSLDLNGDNVPELTVWREAETDTTATGLRVFDLQNQQLLWDFDFPADQLGDTLRRFHGFHDANGDGERELFLGGRTVVTQDGAAHQPFGAFRVFAIFDMDGDGYEDVIGRTLEGRVQIWGKMTSTTTAEPGPIADFTVFPNPTSTELNLSVDLRAGGAYTLRLIDGQGREIRAYNWSDLPAGGQTLHLRDLEGLPAGLYFCQLIGTEGRMVRPVVIR